MIDVQFIYAAHFARQEIVLTFVLIFALYFFISHMDCSRTADHMVLGTIIGLSIGIHPNSFIISIPFVFIYLYQIFAAKRMKMINLLTYISVVALFASGFITLSFSFDPDFITNYSRYGEEFEVFSPVTSKIAELKDFYLKLFYGISGTYYTPAIKLEFVIFTAALAVSVIKLFINRNSHTNSSIIWIILSILGINTGIAVVGRYNQTSIIFLFPLFYILVVFAVYNAGKTLRLAVIAALILVVAANAIYNMVPYMNSSYNNYLAEISKAVGKDDPVIANLNAEFYFNNGRLHDYRNLAYLKEKGINFEQYVKKNNIKYIIYYEELDLIYSLRPKWNGIYGSLTYLDEMKRYLSDKCKLVHQFKERTYGVRIVRYINTRDWNIKIYRVSE